MDRGARLQASALQLLTLGKCCFATHSALIPAALMIGHHFSISAFWSARSASGVCWSRGKVSCARSANRARIIGSAKASVTAALSLAMIFLGVALGTQRPYHCEI